MTALDPRIAALPKAELHLHLEGSISPLTAVELAARYGVTLTETEVAARYNYADFLGFLEAFKWVTSFLRTPRDYALVTTRLADALIRQNVIYAELMISIGVMHLRGQDADANFAEMHEASRAAQGRGLTIRWIFDAARQFGVDAALEVARCAVRCAPAGDIVGFGLGGDELFLPAAAFRGAYDLAAAAGLRRHVHAGEVGGPECVREAIRDLGAERIGHGIAALNDPALIDLLVEKQIALDVCPTSNICTGALAAQLRDSSATMERHPLKMLFDRGIPVTLSTDDPAMFRTDLLSEYAVAQRLGFLPGNLAQLAESGFRCSFLPPAEKDHLLAQFHSQRASHGLADT